MRGMDGTDKKIRFITNSEGIRGGELSPDSDYRILVLGGSAAECQFIDEGASWPQVLENRLNALGGRKVWVGNCGRSGLSTREFYMHLKHLLPRLPGIDMVLVMSGTNNLLRRLIEDDRYDPLFLDHYQYWEGRLIEGAFSRTPNYKGKFRLRFGYYDETAIGHIYACLKHRYFQKYLHRNRETGLLTLRKRRREARELIGTLPDLTSGLEEFSRNLNAMIDLAKSHQTRIAFMTQPTLWKSAAAEHERGLLWAGWRGSAKTGHYYTVEALRLGMRFYNKALRKVCLKRGVECIDLDGMLSRDPSLYYDDSHFTVKGCREAADSIFRNMAAKEPFLKSGATGTEKPAVIPHRVPRPVSAGMRRHRRRAVTSAGS